MLLSLMRKAKSIHRASKTSKLNSGEWATANSFPDRNTAKETVPKPQKMAKDSCLARITAGVAIGGAVGGAVGTYLLSLQFLSFPL